MHSLLSELITAELVTHARNITILDVRATHLAARMNEEATDIRKALDASDQLGDPQVSAKVLRSADRDALRKLVERIGGSNIDSTNVISYVQISGDSNNDSTLSRARAQSTAAVLRSLGVQGKITTSGNGVLKAPSSQARSAVVTFTYRK